MTDEYEAAAVDCDEIADEMQRQGCPDAEEAARNAACLLRRARITGSKADLPAPVADLCEVWEEMSEDLTNAVRIMERACLARNRAEQERDALKAEVERLRAALPRCAACGEPLEPGHDEIGRVSDGARMHPSCVPRADELRRESG